MKKNYTVILTLFSFIILLSCKRDKFEPYFGPQACPDEGFQISTPFTMSKADPATVNFILGEALTFNAIFNSKAPWKIEISGQSSHAIKTFQGFSDVVNVKWYGRADTELFFTDEKVTVKFSITCKEDLTVIQSVNIKKSDFSKDPNVVIVNDFDGHPAFPLPLPDWEYYPATDPLHIYPSAIGDTFSTTINPSPQGGKYISYNGISPVTGGDSKNIYGEYDIGPPSPTTITTDPDKVWFNFLANSGNTPVKIIVSFLQDTIIANVKTRLKLGKSTVVINSPSWQMFSINLGQLEKGPTDKQTFNVKTDITLISINIVQNGGISPTDLNMDLVTFTEGESFLGQQVQK
jgi:hypothetical protein